MSNKYSHLKIQILQKEYQYTLLEKSSDVSKVISHFHSVKDPIAFFISKDEKSLIAPVSLCSDLDVEKSEAGWSCFKIVGSMPFGTVQGLIATISNALIKEQIGVCVVSTFSSDWFFIRSKYIDKSIDLLIMEGWTVEKESIN